MSNIYTIAFDHLPDKQANYSAHTQYQPARKGSGRKRLSSPNILLIFRWNACGVIIWAKLSAYMLDGTILRNGGVGVRWGGIWQEIDGGTPYAAN